MSGKLEKLTVESYLTPLYIGPPIAKYSVMFNPASYKKNYAVEYYESKTLAAAGGPQIFNRIVPADYSIEFLVDGTGTSADVVDVASNVEDFLTVCGKMSDQLARPAFLKLVWGTLVVKVILKSAEVNYTLFKPDGTPLRARVTAVFSENMNEQLQHILKSIPLGDEFANKIGGGNPTLTAIAQDVYKDPSLYVNLASANGLKSIRSPFVGTELKFPKLKK